MDDRRYNEQEVAEIFGRAAEAQQDAARALPPGEGTTLAELQDIGRLWGDDRRGNVKSEGGLRQWTNGNLQVLLQPTEHGDRLQMRTVHGSTQLLVTIGAGVMAVPVLVAVVAMAAGLPDIAVRLRDLAPMGLMGAATLGVDLARLGG